jgi:2'-5' RNA ligase
MSTGFSTLARPLTKTAQIKLDPRQLFLYVPLPEATSMHLERVRDQLALHRGADTPDIDHVTLLYIPKADGAIPPLRVKTILDVLRARTAMHAPIAAKVQGWGYFDGADGGAGRATALVALLDAPGLEDLHVDLKSAMRDLGHPEAGTHGFVPHVTFAYLPMGTRIDGLPQLDGEFTIDRILLAHDAKHELRLSRSHTRSEKAVMRKVPEHVRHRKHASAFMEGFCEELDKAAHPLTAMARKHIATKNFALPGGRYPIHDEAHARNALARVAQHGTPEERALVQRKVHRKFPSLGRG